LHLRPTGFTLAPKAFRLAQLLYVTEWKWLPQRHNKAADRLTRLVLWDFRSDPIGVRQAWKTVLNDHVF